MLQDTFSVLGFVFFIGIFAAVVFIAFKKKFLITYNDANCEDDAFEKRLPDFDEWEFKLAGE